MSKCGTVKRIIRLGSSNKSLSATRNWIAHCPHDELSVALKLSTFITTSIREDQDDDDDDTDTDYDSFQMDLFRFLV